MKLSDVTTERLQKVAENFASSKSDQVQFFQYPDCATTIFTKNEIIEELESRRSEECIPKKYPGSRVLLTPGLPEGSGEWAILSELVVQTAKEKS